MTYQLVNGFDGILVKIPEQNIEWWVKNNPEDRMWQAYQAWLAADPENQPLPAEEE